MRPARKENGPGGEARPVAGRVHGPAPRQRQKNLLCPPGPPLLEQLAKALAATAGAFPVPRSHRADLPRAIQDLSRLLTMQRGDLARSYWSASRYLAAYIHYFLPWNLLRLSWLLPGLSLLPEDVSPEKETRILDLGSGPLTLPLALWCARPDLHSLPIRFLCTDVATRPMQIGLAALRDLAQDRLPWKVDLMRGPLFTVLAESPGSFDCIMAGNVLNEIPLNREGTVVEGLEDLLFRVERKLVPQGRVFFLEPGTRLGGKLIAIAREAALGNGLEPLAPCMHSGPCPMLAQRDYCQASPPYGSWCHFTHPATGVPEPLARLSREARLEKGGLSVSCLLLRNTGRRDEGFWMPAGQEDARDQASKLPRDNESGTRKGWARIISQPIRLPREETPARYACTAKGLALLRDAGRIPSGAAAGVVWPHPEERDAKTGALMLTRDHPAEAGPQPRLQGRPSPCHYRPGGGGKRGAH